MELERVRILPARVTDGNIEIDVGGEKFFLADDVVANCSKGADSVGIVIIGDKQTRYFTNTQADSEYLISQLVTTIEEISSLCNRIFMTASIATDPQASNYQKRAADFTQLAKEIENHKLI